MVPGGKPDRARLPPPERQALAWPDPPGAGLVHHDQKHWANSPDNRTLSRPARSVNAGASGGGSQEDALPLLPVPRPARRPGDRHGLRLDPHHQG